MAPSEEYLDDWFDPIFKYGYIDYFKGDLGAIDERYDVAISTTCGALVCRYINKK